MPTGAITGYIDVAQLALYVFWIFFAGLIFYLRREDKREGYPLFSDRSDRVRVQGFPPPPPPKVFVLQHGGTRTAPRAEEPSIPDRARPIAPWLGAPMVPLGDPMLDGVGPASYAQRADVPDLGFEDASPRIVPLRVAANFSVEARDPDPRGMSVIGADRRVAGTVVDVWVDRSELVARYLEVEITAPGGARRVLLPTAFVRYDAKRSEVKVASIKASQFAGVPAVQNPDQITLREEDRIAAYFASGHLYADPSRVGPLI
jgi:photosynthetic reaction center H subunit